MEAITELVVRELEKAPGRESEVLIEQAARGLDASSKSQHPKVLIVPGAGAVADDLWAAVLDNECRPSVLVSSDFPQDELPASLSSWPIESRTRGWSKVVADYTAVCLVGPDLSVLGSLSNFGGTGSAQAQAAVAGLAAGQPVFMDHSSFERVRRHSARLAPGFVGRLEDCWRIVASFGVEFGGPQELSKFLKRLSGPTSARSPAERKGGRDVVTTEDVIAAREAGHKSLRVGLGAIVTPLAKQQAQEWGIEVKFQ